MTVRRIYNNCPSVNQLRTFLKEADKLQPNFLSGQRSYDYLNYKAVNDAVALMRENHVYEKVYAKAHLVNSVYSTRILDVNSAARQLFEWCQRQDFDNRVNGENPELVNDIKRITLNEDEYEFMSFASKYCHCHNPERYPIYDRYAWYGLKMFLNHSTFRNFVGRVQKSRVTKDYSIYKEIVDKARDWIASNNNNQKLSYRELDRYLWILGKAYYTEIECANEAHLTKKGKRAKIKLGSPEIVIIEEPTFSFTCPCCGTMNINPLTNAVRHLKYFGTEE